ncbi:membrane-associated phosphatidylinositol transfer protein 3 [Protopterus annectens]|uniref:membrane-associated phosphatidylinositol transfer protein 3 n=1 Tax=Protopterus annectens TaxID=7888 RepID=UPI001CFA9C67|nr:membrane-associated phosphatidylinositol transfer protein 3 [Protopterus annectens]
MANENTPNIELPYVPSVLERTNSVMDRFQVCVAGKSNLLLDFDPIVDGDVDSLTDVSNSSANRDLQELETVFTKLKRLQVQRNYFEVCLVKRIIPRGLRVLKMPTSGVLFPDLLYRWQQLNLELSYSYMNLLIEYHLPEENRLRDMVNKLLNDFKSKYVDNVYLERLGRVLENVLLLEKRLLDQKKTKITRDIRDFKNNHVFTWPRPGNMTQQGNNRPTLSQGAINGTGRNNGHEEMHRMLPNTSTNVNLSNETPTISNMSARKESIDVSNDNGITMNVRTNALGTDLTNSTSMNGNSMSSQVQRMVNKSGMDSEDKGMDSEENDGRKVDSVTRLVADVKAITAFIAEWDSCDDEIKVWGVGGEIYRVSLRRSRCTTQSSIDGHEESEDMKKCKTQVLILVLHGGNILDSGGGDLNSKISDVNTLSCVFEKVTRAHFPAAFGHILIKLIPCPSICSEAFSLVSNLNPYSYDENSISSSEDHIPLAALPLLAISSPQYQDAVATVISRANQTYGDFLKSEDGTGFSGQVCIIGDCVGGIIGFDALCYSASTTGDSPNSSRRGSVSSTQDNPISSDESNSNLYGSKRLSKSNIDISGTSEDEEPRKQLPRKQSDSSTYDCDSISQHHAFLSSIHSSVLKDDSDFQPASSSSLSDGNPGRFEFEVSDFFLFGSPLGLVLAMRRTVLPTMEASSIRPACGQVYNFFHSADPSASRLEPLLLKKLHQLAPVNVPRYQRYPLGDGKSTLLADAIHNNSSVFLETSSSSTPTTPESPNLPIASLQQRARCSSLVSINSEISGSSESLLALNIANITSKWWGTKRIDYALYCPDVLTTFPTVALPHLFHASYWESTDVVAFILRQVMRYENVNIPESDWSESSTFSPSNPKEKWLRKRTHVKLRNVTANHRVNDVIASEDGPKVLVGRFMYGPLDMVALTGEKVDILIMSQPPTGRWVYYDTEITNSSGRISYLIPDDKKLGVGVYLIKMVVRGDQTSAESYLTVLPKGMECVVFSIDGSFAASVSIMGSDPKVRAGAVDVVRHWQDLGYLIIYITGRPDMQKQRVVSWLAQHNFPHGMIFFSDGLVHDPLRQKTIFLRNLMQECHIKISSAYGSMKDISVYSTLGLSPSQIYIVGRPSKKYQNQCQFLSEGYAAHLANLEFQHHSRLKKTNTRMILRKGSFGLHAQPEFLRKRTHLRRTMSVQQPDPPSTNPKPERAQSQPESDKDHERHLVPMAWVRGGHKSDSPS